MIDITAKDVGFYGLFLTVFLAVALTWGTLQLRRWLKPRLSNTNRVWDYALIRSADKPFLLLIWVLALNIVVTVLGPYVFALDKNAFLEFMKYFDQVTHGALVMALFWFVLRYYRIAEHRMEDQIKKGRRKRRLEKSISFAVSQVLKIILIVAAALSIFSAIFPDSLKALTPLLTVGGVGGIALSFAAKDSLANFIGGFMIYWDRPFSVGDWISSPDRNIEGTVEHIGWRLTKIRTFDKRPLYVPNGVFSTISIENPSRMTNRRIKTTIGLRYEDAGKVHTILRAIEDMLRNHPEIDTRQTLMVNLFEFGPSSLNFFVYTFTKTTNWVKFQAIQEDVFLKVIDIITQHGAECAFPTRTVHLPDAMLAQQPPGETG